MSTTIIHDKLLKFLDLTIFIIEFEFQSGFFFFKFALGLFQLLDFGDNFWEFFLQLLVF